MSKYISNQNNRCQIRYKLCPVKLKKYNKKKN